LPEKAKLYTTDSWQAVLAVARLPGICQQAGFKKFLK